MNDTIVTHPAEIEPVLTTIGLADLLGPDFIERTRIGVRYREISQVAAKFG